MRSRDGLGDITWMRVWAKAEIKPWGELAASLRVKSSIAAVCGGFGFKSWFCRLLPGSVQPQAINLPLYTLYGGSFPCFLSWSLPALICITDAVGTSSFYCSIFSPILSTHHTSSLFKSRLTDMLSGSRGFITKLSLSFFIRIPCNYLL